MTQSHSAAPAIDVSSSDRLPLSGLLALAMAGFITILTEALPAGLLPQIGTGLTVSEALVGQMVTIYAIGSLAAAIPLTATTQGMRRRTLLLAAIAGYAARMAPKALKGRAIAIAMVGTPLALSLGVPAGTFFGTMVGWRTCFGLMSGLTLVLIVWVLATVPDFPRQVADRRQRLGAVFVLPGVRPVLFVTLAFVLAHNILYTYIAPFLAAARMAERTDLALLVFGATSLAGIWIVGVLIDRRLRTLTLASTAMFGLAALALGFWDEIPVIVYGAVAIWGLAFGGAATLFQTALSNAAGDATDVAQAMLVTAWNTAIAGGGIVGGLILENAGVVGFAPALLLLLVPTFLVALRAHRHGFPPAAHA